MSNGHSTIASTTSHLLKVISTPPASQFHLGCQITPRPRGKKDANETVYPTTPSLPSVKVHSPGSKPGAKEKKGMGIVNGRK